MQPSRGLRTLLGVQGDAEGGEDTDEQVLARVADGDADAFGVLYARHQGRLRRHVLRLLEPGLDADDVVATVFLEAWRRRRDVRFVGGSALPWLLITATNAVRNHRRAARRYRRFLDALPTPAHQPDFTTDSDLLLDRQGVTAAVRRALGALNEKERGIVTLCVFEQLPLAAAAELLDRPVGTVKAQLHRARKKLVDRLAREGIRGWADDTVTTGGEQR